MSYISKELVTISDYNDFFLKLKGAMVDAGWVIEKDNWDGSTYQSQNFVASTNLESGDGPTQYVRIKYYNTGSITSIVSVDYDSGTDVQYLTSYTGNGNGISNSAFTAWFYGDKDAFYWCTKVGSSYYNFNIIATYEDFFGNNIYIPNSSTSDSSSTSIVVASGDESKFEVGTWQYIIDPVIHDRLIKKIIGIDVGTHTITFDTVFTITSGSWMGIEPYKICSGSYDTLKGCCGYGNTGNSNAGYSVGREFSISAIDSINVNNVYGITDAVVGTYTLLQRYLVNGSIYSPTRNQTISDVPCGAAPVTCLSAPEDSGVLNCEDLFGVGEKESGNVTLADSTSITDSTATFPDYSGKVVLIISGTGAGQSRTIISNTGIKLTVQSWNVVPDDTSVYMIADESYRYFKFNNEVAFKVV